MSNRLHTTLAAAVVLALMGGAALADPITYAGDFSITDTSPTGNNKLTVVGGTGAFSEQLSLHVRDANITLGTFSTADTNRSLVSLSDDTIEGTFHFTQPVAQTTTIGGTVWESTLKFFGHFSSAGWLTWDTRYFNVSFADGSILNVGLGDTLFANLGGTADAGAVSADFTLIKDPVPEPASLALFGVGLLGLGTIGLRRLSSRTAV